LTALDYTLDHPVNAAAVQQLCLALGPHAGDVVILAVLDLTGALPLPAQHVVYRFGPDGEFHQIYVIGQVYAPDVVV
jgi:hypothetical protein